MSIHPFIKLVSVLRVYYWKKRRVNAVLIEASNTIDASKTEQFINQISVAEKYACYILHENGIFIVKVKNIIEQ